MSNVAFNYGIPEVNGTFNNWCGNCAPMSDADGDNIWTLTIPLQAGSYQYKFSYDSWSGQEALTDGSACTITTDGFTNRNIEVSEDVNLGVVCWESCSQCETLPVTYTVDFQVDMQTVVGVNSVEVNGTFNNWCGACFPLSDADGDGIWTGSAAIAEGTHEYKFTYNGGFEWEQLAAGGSCTVTNGDFTNRQMIVTNDVILPVVCWQSCDACGPPAEQYSVTFQVDMQNESGFTIPEVNGTFNGWCGGCFPLTDDDGDGIWTGTAVIPAGVHEYKFAYDSWTGQENLSASLPCVVTNFGFTNRSLIVTNDIVLPVVCWGACGSCEQAPQSHQVTFQVDMNGVAGFNTPEVNGTFNNWCGNCFQMSDVNGDGIWQATTTLLEGIYEYKFSYDNWSGSEQLTAGDPCTLTNGEFVNRALNLESDTVLAPVCWAQCDPCSMPEPVSVTFTVDVTGTDATSVEISGSFNDYCSGCQPMTALGDNLYSTTISVMPGVLHYWFTINNGATAEVLQESTCTVSLDTIVVREVIASESVNVDVVCWESCSPCLVDVFEIQSEQLSIMPNPANESVNLFYPGNSKANYQLVDQTGRIVLTGSFDDTNRVNVSTETLPAGIYQIVITHAEYRIARKLIVQH
jgi:hypothetical protein